MKKYGKIVKISPFISTLNIGDYIISDYCDKVICELFDNCFEVCVPTREKISKIGAQAILTSDYAFVCGTNLLSSNLLQYRQWEIDLMTKYKIASSIVRRREISKIKNNLSQFHIILLGVGWWSYQDNPSLYTQIVLTGLLDKKYLHSVRDSYTEQKLRSIGINNVLNTSCPTMWGLTKEFCSNIPKKKKESVITTITDYRQNIERDSEFLNVLLAEYKNVYLWPQSYNDIKYFEKLSCYDAVNIISPTLKCYDDFLESHDVDYIGTRLHGGIRALNHKKRTCIIGVDNRALEIAKDTRLPVIEADNIKLGLKDWIYSEQPTSIEIPIDNINKWKSQFCEEEK